MEFLCHENLYVAIGLILLISTIIYLTINSYDEEDSLNMIIKVLISLVIAIASTFAIGCFTYQSDEILTGNYWD